jgi:hypothetical protein
MTALRPAAWLLLLTLSCASGSGSKPADSAAAEGDAAEGSGDEGEEQGASAEAGDESSEPSPRKQSCDDGTCSPCGDSFCLAGWYCDETAKGGPSCSWLRECPEKVSCSCLNRVFSGCSCEEKAGGVHLSCG